MVIRNPSSMNIKSFISIILFCAVTMDAAAQSDVTNSLENDSIVKKESLGKRLNQKLSNKYYSTKYDTNYVVRPKEKWLLRAMVNMTGNHIHAKGTVNDIWSKYDLHTKRNTTVGLEVNYCDIAVSLSLNPAKMRGDYDDYEFNFEYHANHLSFDINYQRATSLTGDMKLGDIDHLDEEGLRMNIVNVAAYYSFNHRRFSFPAALYQNYYQRRSAGSWLAGASFQGGSIRTTDALAERSPQAPDVHLTFANFALGGGYGYNLVLGKHSQWLLHLSFMPNFVIYKHNKLEGRSAAERAQGMDYHEKRDHGLCFNMIFNERASVVYHFTPRINAGASFMMSNSIYDKGDITINQNKLHGRAFIGVRL